MYTSASPVICLDPVMFQYLFIYVSWFCPTLTHLMCGLVFQCVESLMYSHPCSAHCWFIHMSPDLCLFSSLFCGQYVCISICACNPYLLYPYARLFYHVMTHGNPYFWYFCANPITYAHTTHLCPLMCAYIIYVLYLYRRMYCVVLVPWLSMWVVVLHHVVALYL